MNESFQRLLLIVVSIAAGAWLLNRWATAPTRPKPTRSASKTSSAPPSGGKVETAPSGLKYIVHKRGTGKQPTRGTQVKVHYTGWLWKGNKADGTPIKGKKFDSSRDRGTPLPFPVGMGRVIRGWDQGIAMMKVGGRRTLIIPPRLGYGKRGAGRAIPPNSTLVFDVELVSAK